MLIVSSSILLDLLIGDPRWLPHPVRLIGKLAKSLEVYFRRAISSLFWAGAFTSINVYVISFFMPFLLLKLLGRIHPILESILAVYVITTTIATRDLLDHSLAVYHALKEENIIEARKKVGMIVGRDTGDLSKLEVIRACIESVAESLVDGVTAPIFFAIFGGPSWAMLYRSINTLDSLFGYKNQEYEKFGKFPARIDDLANYIPARVTAPLVSLASAFLFYRPINSLKIFWRDGKKHPSPNSGLSEAAVAGALGVRLGGINYYNGIKNEKQYLGDPIETLTNIHILRANKLILLTTIIVATFLLLLQCKLIH